MHDGDNIAIARRTEDARCGGSCDVRRHGPSIAGARATHLTGSRLVKPASEHTSSYTYTRALAWCAFVIALASIGFDIGCAGDDAPSLMRGKSATPGTAPSTPATSFGAAASDTVLADSEALAFLHDQCAGCHGPKPTGDLDPLFPMPATMTRESLEVTDATIDVYESLLRKQQGKTAILPAPMPPSTLDTATTTQLAAVLHWFEAKLPFTVYDADVRYGRTPTPKPAIDFKCTDDATLRTFLGRVTHAALERDPSAAELEALSPAELDEAVTHEQRAVIVSKLRGEWKAEFQVTGLFKLATAIAGAGAIVTPGTAGSSVPRDTLAPAIATDLDGELYQQMLASYDAFDYREYFLTNNVMVTPRTSPLYGCGPGSGAPWQACTMQAPRAGFFTTLGFLNTNPQTFMSAQNNFGRVKSMWLTLFREAMPRSGDPLGPAPKVADCIDATDTRVTQGPFPGNGAHSQLEMGAACQGCHLGRGLAAGSVLFRPFSTTGLLYDANTLGAAGTPDAASLVGATSSPWSRPSTSGGPNVPVDAAFLKSLLTTPPKACAATGDPMGPLGPVTDIAQLAGTFMADQDALMRGFVRHAQHAFGATDLMTLEMANRVIASAEANRSRLPDLIEAYFMADSFACGTAQ